MLRDLFGIVGSTLAGSFRVEEVVAEGGYGVVYRAEHTAFRAPVALKCLKVGGSEGKERDEFLDRFREEAEILFHLSAQIQEVVRPLHADAIKLDTGELMPFIAMEWVEGTPLDSIVIVRERAGEPPLSMLETTKMLAPIAHALARAHALEPPEGEMMCITHCDLKPENILITVPGSVVRAKILDYGIARVRAAARQAVGQVTSSEAAPFTPGYGAPEQWVPKRYGQTGPWTDVWGLALTMVECVKGRPPIEGDRVAMMGTVLDEVRRPTPRREGADVSDAVEAVFERALATDPRRRYQSIESFWTDLERAQGLASSFERLRRRHADYSLPPASDRSGSYPISGEGSEEESPAEQSDGGQRKGEVGSELVIPSVSSAGLTGPEGSSDRPAPHFDLALSEPPAQRDTASQSGTYAASSKSGAFPAHRPGGPQPRMPRGPEQAPAHASVMDRIKGPLILGVLAVAVTVLDMVVAGGALTLGPIKLRWLAGLIVVVALVWALVSMVGDKEDDE